MNARDETRKPMRGPRECPGCGQVYNRFNAGYSFRQVKEMMWVEKQEKWRYRRRPGVLGYWRQLKTGHWNHHVDACSQHAKRAA